MFFASTQEYRMSRNSAMQARALTTAEYGMNSILTAGVGNWNPWNTATNGLVATKGYAPNKAASTRCGSRRWTMGNF